MAKLSELKKVQLLEEAVLANDLETVKSLYKEHKKFEFTARALGIACRFSGAEMVELLLKKKASFKYGDTGQLVKKYDCRINLSNNTSIPKQYELWVLPQHNVEGYDKNPISEAERCRVLEVLKDKEAGNLPEVLYYAILYSDQTSIDCLNTLGVNRISGWRTSMICGDQGYINTFEWKAIRQEEFKRLLATADKKELLQVLTNFMNAVEPNRIQLFPKDFVHYVFGKGEVSILDRFCSSELFDFFAKKTNLLESAKKWDVLSGLVKGDNAQGIAYVLKNNYKLTDKELDELLQMAQEGPVVNPELVGYIMEYKKDYPKSKKGVSPMVDLELTDKPLTAAEIKKQWTIKSLEDGTVKIMSYKGDQSDIHIPQVIGKKTVSAIDRDAFNPKASRITPVQKKVRENIVSIEFPGSIKEIPDGMFSKPDNFDIFAPKKKPNDHKLTTIILNDGVVKIGANAFKNAKSLSEIVLPGSLETIGNYAFAGCENLKTINLPDGINEYPYGLFAYSGLVEITIPDCVNEVGFDTFSQCKDLVNVNLSKRLTKIPNGMFSDCKNLKEIEIPSSINEIGEHAFRGSGLEICVIPDSVKSIGRFAFEDCRDLKSIRIADTTEVQDCCFKGCNSLYLEGNSENCIVFRNVLHGYKQSDYNPYCLDNAVLPPSVKTISEFLWKELPDIVYHPFKKSQEHEKLNIGKVCKGDEIEFGYFPLFPDCVLHPLKWKVLSVEGDCALLITKQSIISVNSSAFYNDMGTWDKSKIRKWLNKSFLSAAFTESEQKLIKKVSHSTPKNPFTKKDGGKDTQDSVFLLSFDEVEKYIPEEKDREAEMTEYAETHHQEKNLKYKDQIFWETRTIGGKDGMGSIAVFHNGKGYCDGAHYGYYTLRPAIWVTVDNK